MELMIGIPTEFASNSKFDDRTTGELAISMFDEGPHFDCGLNFAHFCVQTQGKHIMTSIPAGLCDFAEHIDPVDDGTTGELGDFLCACA